MTIKVWDYIEEYEDEKTEIHTAIEKVMHSGRLILGESVQSFEHAFASYCGVKHGIGVDNATNGLFLALKALKVGQGDEVITVSNTAVPTVSAIVSAGATPVFVDIDPMTYLMDTNKLEAAISDKTKCIIPVHLFGQCVNMEQVLSVAKKYGLKILEDCAQAHGASQKDRKAGSMSDLAVFSFYPTKPLGGYGDGGMIVTNSNELNMKLRRLRFYGMDTNYYAEEHGYNSRLDELHAEILLRKLKHLNQYTTNRRILAHRYYETLGNTNLTLPLVSEDNFHVYYIFVARHPKRDRIICALKERDILVNISYPWPIHVMRGYGYLGYKEGDLPETERAAKEIFSLPMYPKLSFGDQDKVCETLKEILANLS